MDKQTKHTSLRRFGTTALTSACLLAGSLAPASCPNTIADAGQWAKNCPAGESEGGCTYTCYYDDTGHDIYGFCSSWTAAYRCCPNGLRSGFKEVRTFPCNLFGDDCADTALFTHITAEDGITSFQSYQCATTPDGCP